MDFSYPPSVEAFRAELRSWLDEHVDDSLRGAKPVVEAPGEELERLRAWNRKLADAGYAAISWPSAFGGRVGASVSPQ